MSEPILTWMDSADLDKIAQIDRTEALDALYTQLGTQLSLKPVAPTTARWSSVPEIIEFCRDHMRDGAQTVGAFDDDTLVGVGIVSHNVRAKMAQLAFLYVSNGYRRGGIARRLLHELTLNAKASGHRSMYVSATPTKSAVGFYLKAGFLPTAEPIPHLFVLEPEDIHMIATL